MSSVSSVSSDTSEPPNTPPSFESSTPLISEPSHPEITSPEFMLDPAPWSSAELSSCASHSLPSATLALTYEDLCNAMAPSSDILNGVGTCLSNYHNLQSPQSQSSSFPWESMDETYSEIQRAIDLCSVSSLSSSSIPLDSFDTLLSCQNLDHSLNPLTISPISDTSSARVDPSAFQGEGETAGNTTGNSSHNHPTDYGYASLPFWEPDSSDTQSFLAQWTSKY
ncbi:hypothetical protein FB446DRAFT_737550 [Lentinula raphanica]|nr:hypothetical protein FB446DRAFT_737550 [Lentinula raphanica]